MSLFGLIKYRNEERKWLMQSNKINVAINVNDSSILQKMDMIRLTENDLKLIKCIQPLVKENIDQLVQEFYSTILQVDHLRKMIEKYSSVDFLQETLKTHLIELFNGDIDPLFLEKRFKVAKAHYRIGLEPDWYMGAFQNVQNSLLHIVFKEVKDKEEIEAILSVISKIVSLEQQIVLEAYQNENNQKLHIKYEEGKTDLKNQVMEIRGEFSIACRGNAGFC